MNTTPHLEQLSPSLLTTDKNVRADLQLTKPFLDSIRTNGVLEPIVAYPDPINDGQYRIHLGHRRAAAAIEGDVATVPVYVISEVDAEKRITEQLTENIHRQALSDREVANGYLELSLFGKSAMTIAKSTSSKLAHVGDALKVAKAPLAVQAMDRYQLTIDDALAFVEFDGDREAIDALNSTAENDPARLAHRVQLLRNDRADAAGRAVVEAAIKAEGITLLKERPNYNDSTNRAIAYLYTDNTSSTKVPVETILAEAGADLRAYVQTTFNSYQQPSTFEIGYAVTNWESHGWYTNGDDTTTKSGPLTDDQKDERRTARENNRLWVAATQVRVAWIKELMKRRSLPNDAPALAALYFATLPSDYGSKVKGLTHELLGAEETVTTTSWGSTHHESALPDMVRTSPGQAVHVLLAIAIAGIEMSLDDKKGWASTDSKLPLYLRQLSAWGYTCSPLEETVRDGGVAA